MKKWFTLLSVLITYVVIFPVCASTFQVERWQTANGAHVVFYQTMEVPILNINIAFTAGSAYDGTHFGLSTLTTALLNQGSGAFDANQIAEKLTATGAQYNAETSRDMVTLKLKTLTNEEALNQAVETFTLIMSKPAFKFDAFLRTKNQQLVDINQLQESPDDVANLNFFAKLYRNHPYAHSVKGTLETVKAIQLNDVRRFYQRYFVSSNAFIVLVGAIDSSKAHQLAEQMTQSLSRGTPASPVLKATPLESNEKFTIDYPSSQTMVRLGLVSIDYSSPDYFPLLLGNYILGGGTIVSQLAIELREKRGLTYGVASQFIPMLGNGPFLISFSTKNNRANEALKLTQDTLANFLVKGPTENELMAAKQYLRGNFPLSLAGNSNIANILLRIAFYHLPDEYLETYLAHIETVTLEEVKKAFASNISLNKMLLILVGPTKLSA